MTLEQADAFLASFLEARPSIATIREQCRYVIDLKTAAISAADQNLAKTLWSREQSLEAQALYLTAFDECRQAKYYDAWCTFERCEIILISLRRHLPADLWDRFGLAFLDTQTSRFQSIYPYSIFLSPEIVELEKECTICGKRVSPRHPCGHEVGEIYDGELCCRKVTKGELLSIAMVEKPVQKYSVPFMSDAETGESVDHYKYHLLEYLLPRLYSAFDTWDVRDTTREYLHTRFSFVGRNDRCPCGSGKKYKKCCLAKSGVTMPHKEFVLERSPPSHLKQDVIVLDPG